MQDRLHEVLTPELDKIRALVRRRAGAVTRTRETSNDLVQSICREVLQGRDRLRYPEHDGVRKWIYKTAVRKLINRERFHLAHKRSPRGSCANVESVQVANHSPSQVAIAHETIERAFQELPIDYHDALVMSKILGLPHNEIAELLGRSESAIHSLVSRALARLACSLGQREE